MSAQDDDQTLVEFVAVNGAVVDQPAVPDVLAAGPPRASRRTRLLALGATVAVAAGLIAAAATHQGHGTPSAGGAGTAAATAVPHAIQTFIEVGPSGAPVGELLTEQQARVRAAQQAASLAHAQALSKAWENFHIVRPGKRLTCPDTSLSCQVIFDRLPAPVLAAVTSRIPHAKPVTALEASGYDGDGALYFRQLQVRSGGCVITMQLTRPAADGDDIGDWSQVMMYAGTGRLTSAQHQAADGFVARFRLTGKAAACPSDGTLTVIAADRRLIAPG